MNKYLTISIFAVLIACSAAVSAPRPTSIPYRSFIDEPRRLKIQLKGKQLLFLLLPLGP